MNWNNTCVSSLLIMTIIRLLHVILPVAAALFLTADSIYAIPRPKTTRPRHIKGYIAPERKQAIEELIGLVDQTTTLLEEISNTRQADNAADRLDEIREKTLKLHKEVLDYLTADKAEMRSTGQVYGRRVTESFRRMEKELQRLERRNFYDSGALYSALAMRHPYSELKDLNEEDFAMPVFETDNEREAFIKKLKKITKRRKRSRNYINPAAHVPPSVESERKRLKKDMKHVEIIEEVDEDNDDSEEES